MRANRQLTNTGPQGFHSADQLIGRYLGKKRYLDIALESVTDIIRPLFVSVIDELVSRLEIWTELSIPSHIGRSNRREHKRMLGVIPEFLIEHRNRRCERFSM